MLDPVDVIGVADTLDVPTVGEKPRGDIFREGDLGVAFDGDVVVVPDPAQVIEAQVTRQ
jgi:hypothetical protein